MSISRRNLFGFLALGVTTTATAALPMEVSLNNRLQLNDTNVVTIYYAKLYEEVFALTSHKSAMLDDIRNLYTFYSCMRDKVSDIRTKYPDKKIKLIVDATYERRLKLAALHYVHEAYVVDYNKRTVKIIKHRTNYSWVGKTFTI